MNKKFRRAGYTVFETEVACPTHGEFPLVLFSMWMAQVVVKSDAVVERREKREQVVLRNTKKISVTLLTIFISDS